MGEGVDSGCVIIKKRLQSFETTQPAMQMKFKWSSNRYFAEVKSQIIGVAGIDECGSVLCLH
jgi:hypothetical protein